MSLSRRASAKEFERVRRMVVRRFESGVSVAHVAGACEVDPKVLYP
jgi:hypothetical protein